MADQLITGTTLVESTSRSNGDVPIGGIIPWLKSMTGVYNITEGWVECNGQTLSDSLSSLNGQVIPDLNGDNRFLRGNSTSGDTGGAESSAHNHQWYGVDGTSGDQLELTSAGTVGMQTFSSSGGFMNVSGSYLGVAAYTTNNATATVPPYYNVVWVMRVR